MKLSEQVKLLERENERLQNMIDNLTERLEEQATYIRNADEYIDLTAPSIEKYDGHIDGAPGYIQELHRAYRKIRRKEEKIDGKTGD